MSDTLTPPASAEEVAEARELARLAGLTGPDHALVALVRGARSRRHLARAGEVAHRAVFPDWHPAGRHGRGGVT